MAQSNDAQIKEQIAPRGSKPNCDHKRGTWCSCRKFQSHKPSVQTQLENEREDPNFDYVTNS